MDPNFPSTTPIYVCKYINIHQEYDQVEIHDFNLPFRLDTPSVEKHATPMIVPS